MMGDCTVHDCDDAAPAERDPTQLPLRCPNARRDWCLFLDVDGTLLEFAETPDTVTVQAALIAQLARLRTALSGAVALVSGRTVAQLDRLFAPLQLPTAGVHGLERRAADGALQVAPRDRFKLAAARDEMQALIAAHAALLLEDKGGALALHFRRAPALEQLARSIASRVAQQLGAAYQLLEGHMVFEIKPVRPDKGTAIEAFLAERPFAGRKPVFLADDVTDRVGFETVIRLGGIAIAVGPRVSAPWKLADADAVRRWLDSLLMSETPPR